MFIGGLGRHKHRRRNFMPAAAPAVALPAATPAAVPNAMAAPSPWTMPSTLPEPFSPSFAPVMPSTPALQPSLPYQEPSLPQMNAPVMPYSPPTPPSDLLSPDSIAPDMIPDVVRDSLDYDNPGEGMAALDIRALAQKGKQEIVSALPAPGWKRWAILGLIAYVVLK